MKLTLWQIWVWLMVSFLFQLKWISIETGLYYGEAQTIEGGQITPITTPDSGSKLGWAATIVKTL